MNRWLAVLALSLAASNAGAATLACTSAATLEALVTCITTQMPQRDSNGYAAPTTAQRNDFRAVVSQMMNGQCNFALPASLSAAMRIRTFVDAQNGRGYCLLMEVQDANNDGYVDKGWGTFIVDPAAVNEVHHHAPHPIYDGDTADQAVGIFKLTMSRAYMLCGAHRHANGTSGGCQSSYGPADCAHNKTNMFTAAVQELDAFYGPAPWSSVQWHGMASSSCGTVSAYMTQGFASAPANTTKLRVLKGFIRGDQPTWTVNDPGEGGCTLNATTNIQGRILNGVSYSNACGSSANAPVGDKFIHIEQKPGVYQLASNWAQAVTDTWSTAPGGTATLDAVADTYARDGSYATQNFGTASELHVRTSTSAGYSRQAFLRFDIGAYSSILTATLQLYAGQSGTSEDLTLQVREVLVDSWGETLLNWNNKPAMGPVIGTVTTSGTDFGFHEFDVSAYVAAARASGRTQVSFGLYNPSSGSPYIKVRSAEASAELPKLVVEY